MKTIELKIITLTPFHTGEVRREVKQASLTIRKTIPIRTGAQGQIMLNWKSYLRKSYMACFPEENENDKNSDLVYLFGALGKPSHIIVDFMISRKIKQEIVSAAHHQNSKTGLTFVAEEMVEGSELNTAIHFENENDYQKYWRKLEIAINRISGLHGTGLGGWVKRGYGKVHVEVNK